MCLGDPEHGYYTTREPFGRGGDFVTAPEVSQVFGELIGLWAVATWMAMGSPPSFVLAELGPGRGTLMADLLRAARVRPGFLAAASAHLVETSPRLRALQRAALPGVAVTWHDAVATLPPGPAIVIANEFFDALPVRQFVRTADGWAERMVGLDDRGRLGFGLRAVSEPPASSLPSSERAGVMDLGDAGVLEISPAATAITAVLAARIAGQGGALLAMDYGYEVPAFGDTLQAVRGHAPADPLSDPGEADLTAHVDFAALARAARDEGAQPRPVIGQGAFLARLGIAARAARLAAGKDPATVAAIAAGVRRLTADDAMGTLFKVLAVSHSGLALPAFDDDA
jgi:NADH dehydrogenase [ubiquinone] 1 alpha subcomplex assembly factor 7